jgi:GR25 family glycosyltransferase involved in LPS biosynthesis
MLTLIEKSFVISLKRHPERLRDFFERYPRSELLPDPVPWQAIDGLKCPEPLTFDSGRFAWGCLKSHLNILEHCLNNDIGSYIVYEDDAHFRPEFVQNLPQIFAELPPDWQQLYLGGQLLWEIDNLPEVYSKNLIRPYNVNRTHCYAVNRAGMEPLYKWISAMPYAFRNHIDHHMGHLHQTGEFKVFCPNKWLVGQGGDVSSISKMFFEVQYWDDPASLHSDHWLNRTPACVILRSSNAVVTESRDILNFGYKINENGFDRDIAAVSQVMYPHFEISKWFKNIRARSIRAGDERIPCIFHPDITDEMLIDAQVGQKIFINNPTSVAELESQLRHSAMKFNLQIPFSDLRNPADRDSIESALE